MNDIAIVMVTVDRSPAKNYLGETLSNLGRGGGLSSARLDSFHLADSGGSAEWPDREMGEQMRALATVHRADTRRCANLNAATALRAGAQSGAAWVLFLEDDLDVCAEFLDSVGAWLDDYAVDNRRVYLFGSPYAPHTIGGYHWIRDEFYGTQAFAVRATDAGSLADWLEERPFAVNPEGTCYDLLMHRWSAHYWPEIPAFLGASPSFVQHIGMDSAIAPRDNVHVFPSWPGREWSYVQETRGGRA